MRPDQERVRNLLIDTVTLLCKNSVQFKDELHVEGLLGVSVDKKDVFFVHISKEFTNSPSDGAAVTHDATDSQDEESRVADNSTERINAQHQKLSDKAHEEQTRIKTEVLEAEEECLIVEDPNIKLEGIVSPAQLIAGQRRAVKRTSHGSLMAVSAGHHSDDYGDDNSLSGAYGVGGDGLDNSQYSHMGEPPSKRKAEGQSDDNYMPHDNEDPGGTPWPSIASVPGYDPSQQQSFQQDSDNSQMSMTDGSQPGCSSWSTPGRGPSDPNDPFVRVVRPPVEYSIGGTDLACPFCTKRFPEKWRLDRHIEIHAPKHSYICALCGWVTTQKEYIRKHVKAKHPEAHKKRKLDGEASFVTCLPLGHPVQIPSVPQQEDQGPSVPPSPSGQ